MGLFSSLFGSKENIDYIREISDDLHQEVQFFLKLEEGCRKKVELANQFVPTWNKGDLEELEKHMEKLDSMVRRNLSLLRRFKERVLEQDVYLKEAIRRAYIERVGISLDTGEEIERLKQILELEENALLSQYDFLKKTHGDLVVQRKKIRELLIDISLEARILIQEREPLQKLQKNIVKLEEDTGLMTVGRLIERLKEDILNNQIFERLNGIRQIKEEAARLISSRDFGAQLGVCGQRLIESREVELYSRLELYEPRLRRILQVLQKANERKYKQQKQEINILVHLLNYIFYSGFLKELKNYVSEEAEYMKQQKFGLFLDAYRHENQLLMEFSKHLNQIGEKAILDESVKIYHTPQRMRGIPFGLLAKRAVVWGCLLLTAWFVPLPTISGWASPRQMEAARAEINLMEQLEKQPPSLQVKINASNLLVIAHRGGTHHALENSREAFIKSINAGADMVELDVRLTKDGEVIVMHDSTINRTTNGSGKVSDLTFSQLQNVRMRNGEVGVPTLREILKIVKDNNKRVNIEIKDESTLQRQKILSEKTLQIIEEMNAKNNVVVSSFMLESLKLFSGIGIRTEALFWHYSDQGRLVAEYVESVTKNIPIRYINEAKSVGASAVNLPFGLLSKESVEFIHKSGLQVNVWHEPVIHELRYPTPKSYVFELIKMGVDGVIVDSPQEVIQVKSVILKM